jgi:hypothetical protein
MFLIEFTGLAVIPNDGRFISFFGMPNRLV